MDTTDLNVLTTAPASQAFQCVNGVAVQTVRELEELLDDVDATTFAHHVTNEQNDFAQWVDDVFGHQQLAEELRQTDTPAEARDTLAATCARVTDTLLGHVDDDQAFFTQDGHALYTLQDLEQHLRNMDRKTFHAHANRDQNDFGAWIQNVFGDVPLAEQLTACRGKIQAADAVRQRIEQLHALQRSTPLQ